MCVHIIFHLIGVFPVVLSILLEVWAKAVILLFYAILAYD